jgi:DNA-binding response OmpR family regulator
MPTGQGRWLLVEDQMKTLTKSNPKAEPNDTDEMRAAIEFLTSEGVNFSRPTQYQLKIGDLSFYPDTGRIFRDGESTAWEQRGLEVLISQIRKFKKQTRTILTVVRGDDADQSSVLDLSSLTDRHNS